MKFQETKKATEIIQKKVSRLSKIHIGETKYDNGYVYFDKTTLVGYAHLTKNKIDWIYAKTGHGTAFLKLIEKELFKTYKKIILAVSIDPTEKKDTVIRRINFYIKNNYRVYNIKYRKTHGPLFYMIKHN